jgi:hypothetical protein
LSRASWGRRQSTRLCRRPTLSTCPFAEGPTRLSAQVIFILVFGLNLFAESLVGLVAKGHVPSMGRRHRRVLSRRPQLALGKGQSTELNPGQRLCRELGRGPSAQVASVQTASRRGRRHSGRQPKCDGARSFSDGALRAEGWLLAKT